MQIFNKKITKPVKKAFNGLSLFITNCFYFSSFSPYFFNRRRIVWYDTKIKKGKLINHNIDIIYIGKGFNICVNHHLFHRRQSFFC